MFARGNLKSVVATDMEGERGILCGTGSAPTSLGKKKNHENP